MASAAVAATTIARTPEMLGMRDRIGFTSYAIRRGPVER